MTRRISLRLQRDPTACQTYGRVAAWRRSEVSRA